MHSNVYVFHDCFKRALHFSSLAITSFSSDTKLFQATINTATLQASSLLIA